MLAKFDAFWPTVRFTKEPARPYCLDISFLTRNIVAVAHVVAQCTNRCTRRKVIVGYG